MKVLFAVSSESISEAIIKRYQKEYKEILSYKNVYYFNAILKEIQKDKTYDRIIISEDLEPFSNNNYDTIDKFIFEKLDSISDEAQDSTGKETSIILICTDRRVKGNSILVKLFGIGVYNALLGNDRSMDEVCKLINRPRTKKEAKIYYRIDTDDVNYKAENENEVSEVEIQNILAHFKKLGRNTAKYADSFNNIAVQYTDEQLKIIVNCLPINIKAVLETTCERYQQLMAVTGAISSVKGMVSTSIEGTIKNEISEKKIGQAGKITKPIVIPSAVRNANSSAKPIVKKSPTAVPEQIEPQQKPAQRPVVRTAQQPQQPQQVQQTPQQPQRMVKKAVPQQVAQKPVQQQVPQQNVQKTAQQPVQRPGVVAKQPPVKEEENLLPGFEDIEEDVMLDVPVETNTNVTDTIDFEDFGDLEDNTLGMLEEETQLPTPEIEEVESEDLNIGLDIEEPTERRGRGRPRKTPVSGVEVKPKGKRGRPRKVVEEVIDTVEPMLPGMEDDFEEPMLPEMVEEVEETDDLLPGMGDDFEEDMLPRMTDEVEETDDLLPGMEDDFEEDMLPGMVDEVEESDDLLPGMGDDFEEDMLPGMVDEVEETDDLLPGMDDDFEEDMLPGMVDEVEESDDILPGMEDDFEEDTLPGMADESEEYIVEEEYIDETDSMLPTFEEEVAEEEVFEEYEEVVEDELPEEYEEVYEDEYEEVVEDEASEEFTDEVSLPSIDDLDDVEEYAEEEYVEEDDGMLPGFETEEVAEYEDIIGEDGMLPDMSFDDDTEEDSLLPGFAETDEEEETLLPGMGFSDENDVDDMSDLSQNYQSNSLESIKPRVDYSMSSLNSLITKDKKIVTFIGTSKNGTSFLVNNLAALFSSLGINTAILDMTQNKNSYYIYTKNEEELRTIAFNSIEKLQNGYAEGIKVDKNLTVYTALPNDGKDYSNAEPILSTLVQNHSLILIDCDYETDLTYFASCQEMYLVQSMDILTIQPLTAFLRELKTRGILEPEKIRVVINKELKVKSLSIKAIIGGLSYYNDPAMSFMTELFNKDIVKACTIPFDNNAYSKYLEGIVNCSISFSGYSKQFESKFKVLGDMVYPLTSKQSYNRTSTDYNKNAFSNSMNDTLNKMRKKY